MSDSGKQVRNRLVTAAAREVLRPLGLTQVGRSRVWRSDERYWTILVEFQPSSFSAGSYLNIGACWLWQPRDFDAFDYRLPQTARPWVDFVDTDQFRTKMGEFAEQAAREVRELRAELHSFEAMAQAIGGSRSNTRMQFPAAVAWALHGDLTKASVLFAAVQQAPIHSQSDRRYAETAERLASQLDTPEFQQSVHQMVQSARQRTKLSVLADLE